MLLLLAPCAARKTLSKDPERTGAAAEGPWVEIHPWLLLTVALQALWPPWESNTADT